LFSEQKEKMLGTLELDDVFKALVMIDYKSGGWLGTWEQVSFI